MDSYEEICKFCPREKVKICTGGKIASEFKKLLKDRKGEKICVSLSGGVDNGIIRRIVVIPFNRSIPESERISDLAERIIEHEGDLLVSLVVQAAANVVSRGHYSLTVESKIATEQWFKDVDPVTEWFEDGGLERHVKTAGILVRELYTRFRDDSSNLGITHIPGQNRFKQRLREKISSDPQWDITRRNKGDMLFPRSLVTTVMKFPK